MLPVQLGNVIVLDTSFPDQQGIPDMVRLPIGVSSGHLLKTGVSPPSVGSRSVSPEAASHSAHSLPGRRSAISSVSVK